MKRPGIQSLGQVPDHATVTIHYSLYLEYQDEPYDSSVLRGRAERYKLDDGRLLPGMELAVKSMKKKEQADFLIQPNYAFGEMGCPPRIPANAEIFAKVELIDFTEEGLAESLLAIPADERNKQKTYDELELAAVREHVEGNNFVKEQEWKSAAKRYVVLHAFRK